jgi:hypothetical protein
MLNNLQYQCVSGLILSRGRSIQAAKSLKLRGLRAGGVTTSTLTPWSRLRTKFVKSISCLVEARKLRHPHDV